MTSMPELSQAEIFSPSAPDRHISRREFARRAAVAATTAVVLSGSLLSQEIPPKPASSLDQSPPAAALSPELQAEGELKYQWIVQTYGKRLDEEQKRDLHRLVMEGQKPLAAFRAFPLENGNMPATVLKLTGTENFSEGRD
jgi:hypothetical protein